ncbi:MAG: prevent-host-death protein [Burkholderiaceae bacterium]|nr:prevent-host-death protein [Burkholderiaceae bacterium]
MEAYEKLTRKPASIVEQLAMPGADDIEFEPPRPGVQRARRRPVCLGQHHP